MDQDILLLFPNFLGETFYQLRFDWHLGASYILAYLKEKGIYGSQFIQEEPISMKILLERILFYSPKIAGFTCYDSNYYFIKLITKEIKKRRRDIAIIVGGPTATFSDELILRDDNGIDICVRGEGEKTVEEIINYIKGEIDLINIKGISYLNKKTIIRNPDRPLLRGKVKGEELDVIPSPYLTGILPTDGTHGILTSRGCVYHCTYCNFSAMSKWQVSYHSVNRVLRELKIIYDTYNSSQFQPRIISFFDDTFSLNPHRSKEICKGIIKEKISLPLWCQTRGDCVDEELLELMREANFKDITFGLESSVPENLRTIKKVIPKPNIKDKTLTREKKFIDKIKINTWKAKKLGLNVSISVITGLPRQNIKQAEASINFVESLNPKFYYHDYLTLYPGTPLFETRKKFGIDVIAPKTVLPYKTCFPFDVTKVKQLPNAIQNFTLIEPVINFGINFFTRIFSSYKKNTDVPAVFIDNSHTSNLDFILKSKEIKDVLTLSPIIFFMHEEYEDNIRKELVAFIEKEFPVINLISLKKINSTRTSLHGKPDLYELIFLTEIIERRRLSYQKLTLFSFLPLSDLYRGKRENNREYKDRYRKVVFMKLNALDDKIYFNKLLVNMDLFLNFLKCIDCSDCYIVNQCQWSYRLCPIINENVIFMNGEMGNSFCYNGKNMPNKIKKECRKIHHSRPVIQTYFEEVERRRNCSSCPINKICSKCLFTYPFSEEEFCNIRREGNTRKLIAALENHNRSNFIKRNKAFLDES